MVRKRAGRFPVYAVADRIERVMCGNGFVFMDNGQGYEVEKYDFSTAAPDAIKLHMGRTVLRTSILPAYLTEESISRNGLKLPLRLAGFGKVYRNDEKHPMKHQIEGAAIGGAAAPEVRKCLEDLARELYGSEAVLEIENSHERSSEITVRAGDRTVRIGRMEIIQEKTGFGEKGLIFILDADQITMDVLDIDSPEKLYACDGKEQGTYDGPEAAAVPSPASGAAGILCRMGYQETCGPTMYPGDIYKKMNMIQEAWDRNNSGYALEEKLGDYTALRTVLTPSIEQALAENYKKGNTDVRIFETGHVFLPRDGKILPKEHIMAAMGAYGPDVNIDSFRKDVTDFLQKMGVKESRYVGTGMASAYKWNECYVIMDGEDKYIESNCGQISRKALENFGIGTAAYMANFDLETLLESAHGCWKTKKQKRKDEIDRD